MNNIIYCSYSKLQKLYNDPRIISRPVFDTTSNNPGPFICTIHFNVNDDLIITNEKLFNPYNTKDDIMLKFYLNSFWKVQSKSFNRINETNFIQDFYRDKSVDELFKIKQLITKHTLCMPEKQL